MHITAYFKNRFNKKDKIIFQKESIKTLSIVGISSFWKSFDWLEIKKWKFMLEIIDS
jgi:hypothetical protein